MYQTTQSRGLERKNAGEDPAVLTQIAQEVKNLGTNVKNIDENMRRDLETVRKLAEAKSAGDPLVQSQIDALKESILTHKDALQKQVDEIEKKAGRMNLGAGAGVNQEKLVAEAIQHKRTQMAALGQLKADTIIRPEDVNVEEYKAYAEAFNIYLRRDEKGVDMKTMSVGSDPDGGFFVTPSRSARMLTIVYESSPMRELATVETIGTDALELPIDEDEADAGWVGETDVRTSNIGTPQIGIQRIPVHEIYAKPKATQKLLEDGSIDVGAWLERKIGEKHARVEATAFVTGNGVKKARGILTYSNGTARGQIEQIVSGGATSITFDGLINTVTSLKEPYHPGAAWLMRRATEGAVLLLKGSDGQYLWRPAVEAGKPSTLLGYAVRHAADMPSVAASALAVAFGNFKAGYTIVERAGVSVLRDPYSSKPFVEFYARKRVGGDVVNFEAFKLMVISA
jgi:HK97 family phage major capsid protein